MRGNVFAVTALLFVALGVGGALPAGAKERPVVVGKGAVPVGLIRPSASLTAVEGATYVGSQSCRDCHSKEYTEWAASGHANMLRAVTPDIVKGDFADCEIAYEGVEVEAHREREQQGGPPVPQYPGQAAAVPAQQGLEAALGDDRAHRGPPPR